MNERKLEKYARITVSFILILLLITSTGCSGGGDGVTSSLDNNNSSSNDLNNSNTEGVSGILDSNNSSLNDLNSSVSVVEVPYKFSSEAQPLTEGVWYKPTIDTSWEIQLQEDINSNYDVMLYDVDLFDTDVSLIQALQNSGKKVICYFSAGTYEDWRTDHDNFPQETLGNNLDEWPGEKWLDISNEKIAPVIIERLNLAVTKGCDGVDPDNLDGYTNNTGFALSPDDQLAYNKFIANEARKRGLSVGLKNDLNQISELVPFFDFSINEQCHYYDECTMLSPFIDAKKPVFNIEYDDRYVQNTDGARDLMCSDALQFQFKSIVLPHSLDGSFRYSCD